MTDDQKVNTAERRLFAPAKAIAIANAGAVDHSGLDKEELVEMHFPRPVNLTLPGYHVVKFNAGIQKVPASLIEHPYLAAHGVKPHVPKVSPAAAAAGTLAAAQGGDTTPQPDGRLALVTPEALAKQTKAQLVETGKLFELALDEASKKDDLISAITDAAEALKKA